MTNSGAKRPARNPMYEKIKKQNGEAFAREMREYHNGIFEIENLDRIVKFAGREFDLIKEYLISLKKIKIEEHGVAEDPIELFNRAGYDAYYVNSLEEQNAIKKYFRPHEELCTFSDNTRYKRFHIIAYVKRGAENIKPEQNPKRESPYGRSVGQVQVSGGYISIKNRYNHTVPNPDNTFDSNPDNIYPGMAMAIKHKFNVDFSSQQVTLPNDYTIMNNQLLKFFLEENNVYVGNGFYAAGGYVTPIDKNKQIQMDEFVFDMQSKKMSSPFRSGFSFVEFFNEIIENKKIEIQENKKTNEYKILLNGEKFIELKDSKITYLNMFDTKSVGDNFLKNNKNLIELNAAELQMVEDSFLPYAGELSKINIPKLKRVGDNFLLRNDKLLELNAPELEDVGEYFLYNNKDLSELYAPKLKDVGEEFLSHNLGLLKLNVPKLKSAKYGFLRNNEKLTELNAPELEFVEDWFMYGNRGLRELDLLELTYFGNGFLENNNQFRVFNLPKWDVSSEEREKFINSKLHPVVWATRKLKSKLGGTSDKVNSIIIKQAGKTNE